MKYENLKIIEKKVNELLEHYDVALSNGRYDKSVSILFEIENEIDKLDKNEIKINTDFLQ